MTVELTVANPYKRLPPIPLFAGEIVVSAAVEPIELVATAASLAAGAAIAAPGSAGGHRCGRHFSALLYLHSSTFLNAVRKTLLKIV